MVCEVPGRALIGGYDLASNESWQSKAIKWFCLSFKETSKSAGKAFSICLGELQSLSFMVVQAGNGLIKLTEREINTLILHN